MDEKLFFREVVAKSILRKHKKIEAWLLTHHGMNLYRGCQHNCVYCGGRAEKYQVDGEFGRDVVVKIKGVGKVTEKSVIEYHETLYSIDSPKYKESSSK